MILSRLPMRQVYRHLLPSPVDPGVNGMPRIAVEAVVAAPFGEVRVITTHLEYYSQKQRSAQVEALRAIYAEGHGHAKSGTIVDTTGGPFHTYLRPAATIITGDFNLEPDDPLHARMSEAFADGTPPLPTHGRLRIRASPIPARSRSTRRKSPASPSSTATSSS